MSNMLRPKKFKSQARNRRISLGITYGVLVLMSIIWLIPLLWIILSAFRCDYQADGTFIGTVTSYFFPHHFGLKNFSDVPWKFISEFKERLPELKEYRDSSMRKGAFLDSEPGPESTVR